MLLVWPGGLCLLWNKKVNIYVSAYSSNHIQTRISIPFEVTDFNCTFVYAPPIFQQRWSFQNVILVCQPTTDTPWVCIGDFNDILSQAEKEGLRPQQTSRIDLFRDLLNDTGLMDLDLKGNKFTWRSNPRNGFVTREKLDRVLANWAWHSNYPYALAIALPIITSDHAPIILQITPKNKSGISFKYEAFWDDNDECKDVIQQGWAQGEESMDNWDTLLKKSKSCKRNLEKQHKQTFKKADEVIFKLKNRLNVITAKDSRDIDWDEVKAIQQEIDSVWKREEKYWGQRSRIKWQQWGDRNSKFFHATTIQRRERNRLQRIKDGEGQWVEGQQEVEVVVLRFFQDIYSSTDLNVNRE